MLAQYQANRLENIQKKCLRSIYGSQLSYAELLSRSGLDTLEDRREKAILKFAQKAASNPQFSHWFPTNTNRSSQRNGKKYEEKFAKSDRLYFSPLYTMRRRLNETPDKERVLDTHDIIDLSYLFNAP